jgi:hypothetical protein
MTISMLSNLRMDITGSAGSALMGVLGGEMSQLEWERDTERERERFEEVVVENAEPVLGMSRVVAARWASAFSAVRNWRIWSL